MRAAPRVRRYEVSVSVRISAGIFSESSTAKQYLTIADEPTLPRIVFSFQIQLFL